MQLKEGRLQLCVGECNNGRQRVIKFSSLFSKTLLLRITAQLMFLKGGGVIICYNLAQRVSLKWGSSLPLLVMPKQAQINI